MLLKYRTYGLPLHFGEKLELHESVLTNTASASSDMDAAIFTEAEVATTRTRVCHLPVPSPTCNYPTSEYLPWYVFELLHPFLSLVSLGTALFCQILAARIF
jgi:hypothetical protein